MTSLFLFLIPSALFTVGTVFLVWLACYGYDKPLWYMLPAGLLSALYEFVIGAMLPLTYSQIYSVVPLLLGLLWLATLKIRRAFV